MASDHLIGQLEIVPVREAFRHEALDFTTWLEHNIEALSIRIGLDLTVLEREKAVGPFNVDLLCEDDTGRLVIIENQFGKTDHDHLGKLLTYLVNLEAKAAIWVTPEVRQEHERVIDWLNEMTGSDLAFYLVRVEAVRIGTSPYAPLFTILAGPDQETKQVGEEKKEWAERHHKRFEFWTQLTARIRERGISLFANITPSRDHWLSTGAGRSGITFSYLIWKDSAGIELYIDAGEKEQNKAIFDALLADKQAIETEFGDSLSWERLDEKRASRIKKAWKGYGSLYEPESWPELQDMMIAAMSRFDDIFRKRLRRLKG